MDNPWIIYGSSMDNLWLVSGSPVGPVARSQRLELGQLAERLRQRSQLVVGEVRPSWELVPKKNTTKGCGKKTWMDTYIYIYIYIVYIYIYIVYIYIYIYMYMFYTHTYTVWFMYG